MLRLSNGDRDRYGSGRVLLIPLYATILALALLVRFIWLDSLPGLNGDEAWQGLWVERWLQDHAWAGIAPSGRYPNFFLLGPIALVQAIADPAPWVLRAPTVISDLAFIVVGVIGLRSTIGPRPALIFALLAATAPITIMYSRIGWEPSQTPLATMIFLWACLAGKKAAAVLSLCAAIVVHPMNVFLTPILVAFWLHYARSFILRIPGRIAPGIVFPAVLIGGALAAIPVSLWVGRAPLGELFSGTSFPAHFLNAILSFADLLSGITTYSYIVGEPTGLFTHRMVSLGLLTAMAVVVFLNRRCPSGPLMRVLFVAFACSLISFLIVAGPVGLRPNSERYALFTIAPVLILLSWTLSRPFYFISTAGIWFTPFLAALALISLAFNYFVPLRVYGGEVRENNAGRGYRTAQIEPKMQVAQWIGKCVPSDNGVITVFAESFWLREPLRYYLFYDSKVFVKFLGYGWEVDFMAKDDRPYHLSEVPNSDVVVVLFAGSSFDQDLQNLHETARDTITDAAGRPFINIYTRGISGLHC